MAKKNGNEFYKYEIRRIWIIHALLACKPLRQENIQNIWHQMGETQYSKLKNAVDSEMFRNVIKESGKAGPLTMDDIKPWNYKKINKSEISILLKGKKDSGGLKKDGIINEKFFAREGRGGPPFIYSLVESFDALYKILVEFKDPRFSPSFVRDMTNDLMASEYAERLINHDLVEIVESKLKIDLNPKNKMYVLNILKTSPSALFVLLKNIYSSFKIRKYDFLGVEEREDAFISDLELQLFSDIEDPFFIAPFSIEAKFEIKTSVKIGKNRFEHIYLRKGPYDRYYEPEVEPYFIMDIFTGELKFNDGFQGEKTLKDTNDIKLQDPDIKSSGLKHYIIKLPLNNNYSPLSYK